MYIYIAAVGVVCRKCLDLRYASRHHLVNEQTWSGPTQWLPDGRRRRRRITRFRHHKRRWWSSAGDRTDGRWRKVPPAPPDATE